MVHISPQNEACVCQELRLVTTTCFEAVKRRHTSDRWAGELDADDYVWQSIINSSSVDAGPGRQRCLHAVPCLIALGRRLVESNGYKDTSQLNNGRAGGQMRWAGRCRVFTQTHTLAKTEWHVSGPEAIATDLVIRCASFYRLLILFCGQK